MKREPFQSPQTSMERHVADLVEHLRHGEDTQAGFFSKMEAAQAHAFWLENRCIELSAEVRQLEMKMMPSLPKIVCDSRQIDTRDPSEVYPTRGGALMFDWAMEKISYRVMIRDMDDQDEKSLRRIKRRAYREILTRFRGEFEKAWTFNLSRRRAA